MTVDLDSFYHLFRWQQDLGLDHLSELFKHSFNKT